MENKIVSYDSAKNIIRRDLESMSRKFITIGYYLKLIRDNAMYHQDGFRDIWEFAQDTYGISKSTCSRWMAMNDKFSQGGNSPYLKEEYRDFGKSQLQEMLYLTDEQMEQARPDMTAKEIREIRKPETPKIELKKPDETEREYLNNAAKCLISSWRAWFLQDFTNRVMQVDTSPKEIKKKLERRSRTIYFSTDKGFGRINLFDDCVRVWNERNDCIGDFDWFYLAAAIQSMWNIVAMENAQENQKESIAPVQQEPEEQTQGQMEIQDYPEVLPEEKTEKYMQQETVAVAQQEENQEDYMNPPEDLDTEEAAEEIIDSADSEEKYEELSDKTDMELLRDLLTGAQNLLKVMSESYTENDVRVRKQKLMIGAYAGMIADLDQEDIPETIQPELPYFKNNNQRKEWLRNYQDWGLWYEDKNIGARYYKYDFDNGARLIAETYVQPEGVGYFIPESCYLHLIGGPVDNKNKWSVHANYCKYPNSETELVEFLKYIQKERKDG